MSLPTHCPQCQREWKRMQSPFFPNTEYIECTKCKANAETIMKGRPEIKHIRRGFEIPVAPTEWQGWKKTND